MEIALALAVFAPAFAALHFWGVAQKRAYALDYIPANDQYFAARAAAKHGEAFNV